jgi:hypothetical protein
MSAPKKPWFQVSDRDDEVALSKAFILAGIVTADDGLARITNLSSLRAGLQRLLARVRALTWDYPAVNSKPAIAATVAELAKIYDDAAAKRSSGWEAALRLEVPVTIASRPTVAGVAGLSPEDVYDAVGMGLTDKSSGDPQIPLSVTFTASKPRSGFSFDWPLRVASAGKGAQKGWAATHGYVGIINPAGSTPFDSGAIKTSVDLYLDTMPEVTKDQDLNSVITITDMDTTSVNNAEWRRLADMGAVVLPNVGANKLTSWLNDLTRSLSNDRPFDVAVFEAWHESGKQTRPPMLVAWEGAFKRARLSNRQSNHSFAAIASPDAPSRGPQGRGRRTRHDLADSGPKACQHTRRRRSQRG